MIEFLARQLDIIAEEKRLERDEFDHLIKLSDVKCKIIFIEKWAKGNYIKIKFDSPRLAYQTGELVTLIGSIEVSATVLFDNSAYAILFSRDIINGVNTGDSFSSFAASKNTYSFDVQAKAINRVAKTMGNNRLITSIIKGKYNKIEKKKFKIEFKTCLDRHQKAAIEHAVYSKNFACIFGPPGTGKTTTLAELIYQLVKMGETVLVACPSNAAVDVLFSRSLSLGVSAVRVGKGASVKELILHASSSTLLNEELPTIATESQGSYSRRMKLMLTAKALFTTCIGTASKEVDDFSKAHPFDTLVIDEAGNCLESVCYVGLFSGVKRVIFAGDHFQLPPNVKSSVVPESILERLSKCCPYSFSMLKRQYRMNSQIVEWSNDQFYGRQLESDESVANSFLNPSMSGAYPPIVWYEVEGEEELDGGSKYNKAEAECLAWYLRFLYSIPYADIKDIAIITPYKAQARLLRTMIDTNHSIRIMSVDASQGSEFDVVILSLVSCNRYGCIGFLSDYRRMNVAITRAKRHLAIFGSPSTFIRNHEPYRNLVNRVIIHRANTLPWQCKFFAPGYQREQFILYLVDRFGKFNSIPPHNGYIIRANKLLAHYCLHGNVLAASQYVTPSPLSNVLFALLLLPGLKDEWGLGIHPLADYTYTPEQLYNDMKTLTLYLSTQVFPREGLLRQVLTRQGPLKQKLLTCIATGELDVLWILKRNLAILSDIGIVTVKQSSSIT